ncbi:MAG: hypothetical protein LIO54_08305 [Oscillospiraceae bacterium]|nr:hypothetical protein [Oscillospiraceae bacterium]
MIDEKILWEKLKAQRDENKEALPEIYHHVNMGINQAIGIMNSLAMKKTCGTCKHHDDFLWACSNGDSPRRGDFPDENDTCGAWEAKEPDGQAFCENKDCPLAENPAASDADCRDGKCEHFQPKE